MEQSVTRRLHSNRMPMAMQSVQQVKIIQRQHHRPNSVCIERRLVNIRVRYQTIQTNRGITIEMVMATAIIVTLKVKIKISESIENIGIANRD